MSLDVDPYGYIMEWVGWVWKGILTTLALLGLYNVKSQVNRIDKLEEAMDKKADKDEVDKLRIADQNASEKRYDEIKENLMYIRGRLDALADRTKKEGG